MNSGATSERVYDAIKQRILSRAFHPGERLDPAALALGLSSSITPIRDALHLLAGQGLVETGTGEGFHVPHIDEPALKDLYAWNLELLTLAIRSWPRGAWRMDGDEESDDDRTDDLARAVASLSRRIVRQSANAEHLRAVKSINDRLHALRLVEPLVIGATAGELKTLHAALADQDGPRLRRGLVDYHRPRQRKSADILRAHYRL